MGATSPKARVGRGSRPSRRRGALAPLLAAPLALSGIAAHAQIADPYRQDPRLTTDPALGTAAINVDERTRTEFMPVGGRLGSFFLYPTFNMTVKYLDNVFGTETNKQASAVFTPKLGASLVSDWSRHKLDVDGYVLANRYTPVSSQNSEGYGGHVGGRYDIERNSAVQLDANYDRRPEDRLTFYGFNASLEPIIFRAFNGSARVDKQFGRFVATARYQRNAIDYEDGRTAAGNVVSQKFRDFRRNIYTGIVQYQTPSGFSLIAAGSYDTLDYPTFSAFNRNSDGYRVEGGVGVALTAVLVGEVRVGYLRRSFDDPLIRTPSGVSFYANLLWNVARTFSLRLQADRDIDQGGSIISPGNLRSEAVLSGAWELRRNLILRPSFRYARINPIDLRGTNQETEERLRTTYFISRRYQLNGEIGHYDRTSGLYPPAVANFVSLGFGVTL